MQMFYKNKITKLDIIIIALLLAVSLGYPLVCWLGVTMLGGF